MDKDFESTVSNLCNKKKTLPNKYETFALNVRNHCRTSSYQMLYNSREESPRVEKYVCLLCYAIFDAKLLEDTAMLLLGNAVVHQFKLVFYV